MQAAFKPAPTSSNSKADIDWAAVKMEDKYLMHQVPWVHDETTHSWLSAYYLFNPCLLFVYSLLTPSHSFLTPSQLLHYAKFTSDCTEANTLLNSVQDAYHAQAFLLCPLSPCHHTSDPLQLNFQETATTVKIDGHGFLSA